MTKQEVSVQVDRIIEVISEGYELLNNTGDYESEQLDKATCKAQDILETLQYVKKYELD